MTKITDDSSTWSGTGCFMAIVGVKGLRAWSHLTKTRHSTAES